MSTAVLEEEVEEVNTGGRPSFRTLDGIINALRVQPEPRPTNWEGSHADLILRRWPESKDTLVPWIQEASSKTSWWQFAALIQLIRRGMSPASACRMMDMDLAQWSRFAKRLLKLTEGEDV